MPLSCHGTARLLHLRRRPLALAASRRPGTRRLGGQQQHVNRLEDSSAVVVVQPSFAYPFERLGSSPRDSSNASADGSDAGLCFNGPKPWRRRAGRPS
ncbi:hypothetical protein JCM10296v2_001824 [Rhodotorula toruloides]